MRLSQPRLHPIADEALSDEQRRVTEPAMRGRPLLNIYRTMAHAPDALAAFLVWGGYIFSSRNTLAPRQRELVILRVGYLCRSGYEFVQHTAHGRRAGLTEAEIGAIKQGANSVSWSPVDQVLLHAADQLVQDHFIDDSTWAALSQHFSQRQMMDLVYTAGQYVLVSTALNTFGVQLDPGQIMDPDLLAIEQTPT